ncbi:MAG: hypothetical protein ACRD2W_02395 [Acidimicrobiales bacterium]
MMEPKEQMKGVVAQLAVAGALVTAGAFALVRAESLGALIAAVFAVVALGLLAHTAPVAIRVMSSTAPRAGVVARAYLGVVSAVFIAASAWFTLTIANSRELDPLDAAGLAAAAAFLFVGMMLFLALVAQVRRAS